MHSRYDDNYITMLTGRVTNLAEKVERLESELDKMRRAKYSDQQFREEWGEEYNLTTFEPTPKGSTDD